MMLVEYNLTSDRCIFMLIVFLTSVFCLCSQDAAGQVVGKTEFEAGHLRAPSPPMGWNSWNTFGKHKVSERLITQVIDAIVESGLRDAGYKFVVIDGGWRDTKLGPHGELLPNPDKFPHGIKPLAEYAHSKGLKLGLHTVPGTHDCTGDPVGGYGHEATQVEQFVDWGVDFVKLDKCRFAGGWNESTLQDTYLKWSKLLREKSGNSIVLSISAYEGRDWYPPVCQMARTTEDISAKVAGMSGCHAVFDTPIPKAVNKWGMLSVMEIAEINNKWARMAGGGYWNDPDMLVTGDQGLSEEEQKSHFALWCVMSAPLMLGNDPRNMTEEERSIILNDAAISIDQDPSEQGRRVARSGKKEIWAKQLRDGAVALLLLNRNREQDERFTLDLAQIGIGSAASVRDVYAEKELGPAEGSLSLDVHPNSSLFLKLSK
jgi:alpha-galactosidase